MKFIILIVSLSGIIFLGGLKGHEQKPLYFAPPNVLHHFSLGYRDLMANLLWLRFIQSADFCSFEKGLPVYKGDKKTCEFGWAYRMVDAISNLAPKFRAPYGTSALILSIFSGDLKGAESILLKGLKQFPKDLALNTYATYLYALDLKKPELAAKYAYQAAESGAPYWFYSLAAKQFGVAEQKQLGESILMDLLNKDLSDKQREQVEEHLNEFREEYSKPGS